MFAGDEPAMRQFLLESGSSYYVYILQRPNGKPFYVGEGQGKRLFDHVLEARRGHVKVEGNPHKCNVIRKIERSGGSIRYQIDSFQASKPDARRREGELIRALGRLHEGGPLTNLAGGHAHPDAVAPFSRERHTASLSGKAQDPDKARLNAFFKQIVEVGSTPIKPLRGFRAQVRATTTITKPGALTARSAGALVASAACNGIEIVAQAVLPRRFSYDAIEAVIENGVSENITGSGLVELVADNDPCEEAFLLTANGVMAIKALIGPERLEALGLA